MDEADADERRPAPMSRASRQTSHTVGDNYGTDRDPLGIDRLAVDYHPDCFFAKHIQNTPT